MDGYTCIKTCTLGDATYSKGDVIPFDAVLPSRERALIKQGYIASLGTQVTLSPAEVTPEEIAFMRTRIAELEAAAANTPPGTPAEGSQEPSAIVVPITTKEGVLELSLAPEDIVTAVTTMQLNADDAAKAVGVIEKEETLILIDVLDTRKTVKTAIAERVNAMNSGGEDESKGDA